MNISIGVINMNMNGLLKKRLLLFVMSTLFIVIMTIASSYAFSHSKLNTNVVVINKNNLQILYEDGQTTELNSSYPMSFQQKDEISTKSIKVINKCNIPINFSLNVSNKEESINNLEYEKIYYSINGEHPMILSTFADGIIYYGQVKGNEEYILNIQVWPALEYITNADQGKSVNLQFEILEK